MATALDTLLTSSYAAQAWQSGTTVHLTATKYNALLSVVTSYIGRAPAPSANGGFMLLGVEFVTP